MTARLRRLACVLLGVGFLLTCAPTGVSADPPKGDKRAEKRERKKKKGRKQRHQNQDAGEAKAEDKTENPRADAAPSPRREHEADAKKPARPEDAARIAAQEAAQGVDATIVKEGGTNVKVMSFSGLDIEGRLKSPQLLYFVNRVHAEFERPTLPHRSFMPELSSSTQRDPFR